MGYPCLSPPRARDLRWPLAPRTGRLCPGEGAACWAVLHAAVHKGACAAYDETERAAWAAATPPPGWEEALLGCHTRVARTRGQVVGFIAMSREGEGGGEGGGAADQAHVDYAYIAPQWARRGLGTRLLGEIEHEARTAGVRLFTTEASLVSRPFFARAGWAETARQSVIRSGVALTNFRMEKVLG